MDPAVIEAEDRAVRHAEKDRRMGDDDELGIAFCTPLDLQQKGQLALRTQSRFRFIEQVQAVSSEVVLGNGEKAFAMGFHVVMLGNAARAFAVFFLHGCDIVKALRPQEVTAADPSGSPAQPDCFVQR